MTPYEQRNMTLRRMGFASYEDYLASPLWKSIRKRVMKAAKGRCHICGDPANNVHHTSYKQKILEGKTLAGLVPLCRTCHEIGEFDTSGKKQTLKQANARLKLCRGWDHDSRPVAQPAKDRHGRRQHAKRSKRGDMQRVIDMTRGKSKRQIQAWAARQYAKAFELLAEQALFHIGAEGHWRQRGWRKRFMRVMRARYGA